MGQITFLLGGARSGKSSYAVDLATNFTDQVIYLATGIPCDQEMKRRIEEHRQKRSKSWKTIEEPLDIDIVLKNLDVPIKLILLDCLTLWVSNLTLHYQKQGKQGIKLEQSVLDRVSQAVSIAKEIRPKMVIVSNEIGMGIVPDTSLGRTFRDILGKANQIVAASADQVFFMIAGLPIEVKKA